MKIVSQILSATPNVATKVSPTTDSGADFHGALTNATARSTGSSGKASGDEKPQKSENKKKSEALSSSPSDPAIPSLPTAVTATRDGSTPLVITQAVNGIDLGQSSNEPLNDNPIAVALGVLPGAPASSLAPITVPSQQTIVTRPNDSGAANPTDGNVDLGVPSTKPYQPAAGLPLQKVDSSPISSQVRHTPVPDQVPVIKSASESIATQSVPAGPTNSPAKLVDASSLTPSTNTVETPTLDTQQAPAAIAQSVAATISPASLNPAIGPQPVPSLIKDKAVGVDNVGSPAKVAASRPTAPASKARPAATPSEPSGKASDEKESDTQVASAPAPSTSFVKMLDTTGSANHAAGDSAIAFDSAALQQIVHAGSSDGSSHASPIAPSLSAPVEPRTQTIPAQAAADGQAMQGVTSAQLTQSMRSSEMKLGMQSAEFGNISISTSLNHQAISAQISIDHSELGRALAVHLPAIEEKLGSAYGVQAKVELRDSTNPSSTNHSGYSNSGQQSREQRQSDRGTSATAHSVMFENIVNRTSLTATAATASASRLDIRI